jgi:hypothetical protein
MKNDYFLEVLNKDRKIVFVQVFLFETMFKYKRLETYQNLFFNKNVIKKILRKQEIRRKQIARNPVISLINYYENLKIFVWKL